LYSFMLNLHSYLRWAVVIIGIIATALAWAGVLSRGRWTPQQVTFGRLATIAFDTQALVGVLLYVWLSPITTSAFSDMGAAMKDAGTRFYVAEHSLVMIIAAVLIHIGACGDARKTRRCRRRSSTRWQCLACWPSHPGAGRCCQASES
jgi:hypothetical protein